MNKILFSDFDGTLFFKEGFHQEDIEAIKTFQSKGNKFALCTGRPLGGVNAIDVVKRGCSKGNGILEITKLISDETAGIGDSYNDLEMFKVVNQSFTFKTSPKDIQQQTRYTVSSVKMAIDILNKE